MSSVGTKEFFDLFMSIQPRLYGYILFLVPNRQDADDIFQDTATVMWEKFDQFERETNFFAWSRQIAMNKIFDYRKKKQRQCMFVSPEQFEFLLTKAGIVPDHADQAIEVMKDCLDKLSQHEKMLISQHYYNGVSMKGIAEEAGYSSMHKLYRTMAKIHRQLLFCVRKTMTWETGRP